MAFTNALNEAARDSDVYRMFSRGQGFKATVKCQTAFVVGCVADFFAVLIAFSIYLSWPEAILCAISLTVGPGMILRPTSRRLFRSASIVDYWRTELGGKPDDDDPYDLDIVLRAFDYQVAYNKSRILEPNARPPSPNAPPGNPGGGRRSSVGKPHHSTPSSHGHDKHSSKVKIALF
eukprot:TRINITY_DN13879_c0_g2_i1.p1 TRINITY_DN13879_c0_g2~~TRINITY_DN13879_c0_g2_i1.p1  ORF type:complete len:190 (-),score=14.37 TRINITY_DN13879_c0_g2_i1:226-756(-)